VSVVSNTSPLNYLAWIGCADVLFQLYGKVLVPPAVLRELEAPKTPALVRDWVRSAPSWLECRPLREQPSSALKYLGEGLEES
jgi:predicted nucleic acid-binding protein